RSRGSGNGTILYVSTGYAGWSNIQVRLAVKMEASGGLMKLSRWTTLAGAARIILLVGCTVAEPSSAIVQTLEAAGSDDLRTASADSIQQWLGPRRDLAIEVENMCKT